LAEVQQAKKSMHEIRVLVDDANELAIQDGESTMRKARQNYEE
jgi:hypothetical protein